MDDHGRAPLGRSMPGAHGYGPERRLTGGREEVVARLLELHNNLQHPKWVDRLDTSYIQAGAMKMSESGSERRRGGAIIETGQVGGPT